MYDRSIDAQRRARRKELVGDLYWFVAARGGEFNALLKSEFARQYDVRPADVEIMMSTFLDKGWASVDKDMRVVLNPIPGEIMPQEKPTTLGQLLVANHQAARTKLLHKAQQTIVDRVKDAISTGEWSAGVQLDGEVYSYLMGMKSICSYNGGPQMREELKAVGRTDYAAFGQWLIDEDLDLSFDGDLAYVTYTLSLES